MILPETVKRGEIKEECPMKLKVMIEPGPEADLERLERLTHELRRELRDYDVDMIEIPESKDKPPRGAKVLGIEALGTFFITLKPGALSPIIGCIHEWASNRGTGEVILDLNGQKLQLKNIPTLERQKYISDFIALATGKDMAG